MIAITDKKYMNIWKLFTFLYLFFLITTISNAGTSISLGLVIFVSIYIYQKKHYKVKLPAKEFLYPYILFFFLLFIATISVQDQNSLYHIWKYFTWSLPFWLFYWIGLVTSFEKIYEKCTLLAMLVFSLSSFYFLSINPMGTRIAGFSNQPNLYAILVESVLPYSIAVFVKYRNELKNPFVPQNKHYLIVAGLISFAGFIALLLTQSRGACIGFILGGIILIVRHTFVFKKKFFILAMVIVIVGGILAVNGGLLSRSYDNERILLWTSSYNMWQDHKLFGVGFSNWQEAYQKNYILPAAKEPNLSMPHNVIAYFFSATGMIGGVGYLIFLIGEILFIVKKINKHPNIFSYQAMFWAFISISIHGIVDAGITNKFAMQIFFAYAGIVLAINEKKYIDIQRKKNNDENR